MIEVILGFFKLIIDYIFTDKVSSLRVRIEKPLKNKFGKKIGGILGLLITIIILLAIILIPTFLIISIVTK